MKHFMQIFFRTFITSAISLLLLLVGCDKLVRGELDALQDQIDVLADRVDQLNASVNSLGEIVREIQNGGYVETCAEVVEGGKTIGWRLTFSDGKEIMIYNGKDGADGHTPIIGIRQDTDGEWYWTLDGDWLLNNGSKVKATGNDGSSGQDGVTPRLKIENDYWYVSTDNGQTWTRLGKAKGEDGRSGQDGDSFFSYVEQNGDAVILGLADGSALTIPCYQPVEITFTVAPENQTISAGETVPVSYTLSGSVTDDTIVSAAPDGKYEVSVKRTSRTTGVVYVTCPRVYSDGFVNVIVSKGHQSYVRVINFTKRELSFPKGMEYHLDNVATILEIPFRSNFEYTLSFRGNSSSWITYVETKATTSGTIVLSVAQNDALSIRTGYIDIKPANHPDFTYATITIIQASSVFSIEQTRVNVPAEGGVFDISMIASRGVRLDIPANLNWVSATLSGEGENYNLHLDVSRNSSGESRSGAIGIYTQSGAILQAAVEIVQLAFSIDHSSEMIITMSANFANNSTVYLPISGRCNVYIDWGDGNTEIIEGNVSSISHTYQDAILPALHDVSISGTVTRFLASEDKNGIREIKQWGDLQVKNCSDAFSGCYMLQKVAGDDLACFSDIADFSNMFSGCTRLTEISKDLFMYAQKGSSFSGTFSRCEALSSIPMELFSQCRNATNFANVFNGCTSLSEIPDQLFSGCPNVSNFSGAFSGCKSISEIPDQLFSGCPNVDNFSSAFSGCISLNEIPEQLFSGCPNVSNFSGVFSGCTSLREIPEQLFSGCPNVGGFSSVFSGCTSLREIPEQLFSSCPNVGGFSGGFSGCTSLCEIPEQLFSGCPNVSDFSGVFSGCTSLREIPEHLFSRCPNVTSFAESFKGCVNLQTVPVSIFDENRRVTNFDYTFMDDGSVEGESPYTIIDGVKYHLYERYQAPDYFVVPRSHFLCFADTTFSDRSRMPRGANGWTL